MPKPVLLRKPKLLSAERVQTMNRSTIYTYVTEYGDEERRAVNSFWYSYANRKSLITFGADTNAGKYPRYGYDLSTQKYYYINRKGGKKVFVPATSIKLDIERFGNNICRLQRNLASKLINGTISLQEWYDDTARNIKLSYRAAIDIARGSSLDMAELERQHFQEVMELQMQKLNSLALRIERGDKPLDGTLLNAACQLGHAVNSLFENWKLWEAQLSGKTRGRRVITHAEHCHDTEVRYGCIELARLGWQPIEQVVPIGEAACYGECQCRLEFK